ncbi:MAG TPA: LysR family transcriptional regulator [Stellaceae bacterium]|jgi:DNA-binding transcriptional LysR family regulator|nr:LysR family transcriptional regulator [Stellaceae bacterium]
MRGLNLDQLASFATVVELGSFSAAAERLSLSQPAVSLQIRQLERRLGVALLERVGRRVQPTEAGRNLLPHIDAIDRAVAGAIDAVASHARGVAGRVRLGTGATACIYLLPPVLRELRRAYAALDIVVRTGNTPDILKALEENALDVALVTLPAPGRSLVVEKLLNDEIVAVFAAGVEPPHAVTAAALADLPVVLYEPGGNARRVIDDWFRRAGVSLKPVMELGNIEAIKQLVAAGLGCGLLPRLAVSNEAAASDLVVRSLSPVLHRQIGLVLRRDKVPDRGLKEAIAALRGVGGGYSGKT